MHSIGGSRSAALAATDDFSNPEKKNRFVTFCAFLSYGATQQRRRGTKTRPVGGPFHRTTQQPRSLNSQVHDRGWSCGHGRYIPVSVTQPLYSQGPLLSKDPHGGRYLKRL